MTTDTQASRLAIGQIRLAIQRLAGRYRFHARVLAKFTLQPDARVPTMGVAVKDRQVLLAFNARFVLSIPLDQLVGVLLHEVHHVVFGHVVADPEAFPDAWARTVAEEVTANEFVHEPLPGSPITLNDFPDLPPMESTRQRYRRLEQDPDRPPLAEPGEDGAAAARGDDNGATDAPPQDGTLHLLDDHSAWAGPEEQRESARQTVRELLHDAAIEAGGDQVPKHLCPALRAMGIGAVPGRDEEALDRAGEGRLDWTRLLRRYVGGAVRVRPDYRRPPRRFPDRAGILPGRSRNAARPRVMAVIDTSASMTPDLLSAISAELARLAREFTVTLVECDVEIQRCRPFRPIASVHGRGGTDLRPPFEPAFQRKHRPDLVIYFTDGHGPAPARPPRAPVIWCLTPGGDVPTDWGRVVWMRED